MLDTLEKLLTESPVLALFVIFWIGAVTSLSSCTVIRLPIVLGYIGACGGSRKRSLLLTVLFLLGLVISYVCIGAAAAFVGGTVRQLLDTTQVIFWASGALLFVAGAMISGLVSPSLLPSGWQHVGARLDWMRAPGALVLGAVFGLLTMPACPLCGAGLIVLAAAVATEGLSLYGLGMFASFALGQGLPIVAVGVLTTIIKPGLIHGLRTHMCSVEQHLQLLCGNVLMVLGIYFIVVG